MTILSPQYIVRLVHYHEDCTYALHFELDEATEDPHAPTPDRLKCVSIGYDPEESSFLVVKKPLDGNLTARVIHQFSRTVGSLDIPLLRLNVDPIEEFDIYTYDELYQLCEGGRVLNTVLLTAWVSAYAKPGGRATSQGFLGCMLNEMGRISRILPATELQWARDWLFSQQ